MSRVISIRPSRRSQPFDEQASQTSQIGLQKTLQISQAVPVFVKKSFNSLQTPNEGAQCRICLQNQLESNQKLIQPCQCIGSVQSVHQGCFTQWISRSLSTKTNRQLAKIAKDGIECDLCKMKFQIKFSFEKTCTNMQKLKQKIKRRQCQFITLMSMLLMTLILFAISLALLPENPLDINLNKNQGRGQVYENHDWLKVVLLGSIGLLILIVVFVSYLLISEYGFSYQTEFGYKGKQMKTVKGIVLE